jgi:hypothetical protein
MDRDDSMLRERLARLIAAAPAGPPPLLDRPRAVRTRPTKPRLVLAIGLALLILTSLAVSLPTTSRSTYQSQLRALGVPAGVEIMTVGGDGAGNLTVVRYRDEKGRVHHVGGAVGYTDDNGRTHMFGADGPKATPTPIPLVKATPRLGQ